MRDSEDQEIRAEVRALSRELYRQATALAAEIAEGSGLHPTDVRALRLLDSVVEEPLTAGELGRRLGLSSAAVTGLIDRLEAAGLAERVRDPDDRRRVRIALGATARRLGESQLAPIAARIDEAVDALDHDGLRAVGEFLAALTRTDPGPSGA